MARRRPLLLRLLHLLLAAAFASAAAVDGGGDARVLLKFKRAVTSDPAGLLSLWSGSGHCSWPGVACDASSRVTALNLPAAGGGGGLSGTLTPALGALSALRSLNLAGNLFSGAIPRSLSNCKDLTIVNLSQNNLNGTIHDSLISLPFLRRLSLSYNRISGSIPVTIGVRLQYLDLAGNMLVGGIPGSLGNCSQLRSLVLHSNLLENSIPTEFSRLAKLRVLDVSNNALSGAIPDAIGECKELSVLVLTDGDGDEFNCFQGGLPESVTSLPKLQVLWAPRATVEGEMPGNWGACERLEMVNLGQNLLTGRIPRVFAECKNLKFLNLSDNKLVGWIDEELPVPCMDLFDVSGNQLSGSMPRFVNRGCAPSSFPIDDLVSAYYSSFVYKARVATSLPYFEHGGDYGIYHNFGRNNLTGTIQSLPIEVSRFGNLTVYAFLVDGNYLVGSLNEALFDKCKDISGLVANFSNNLVPGEIPAEISTMCRCLLVLDVAGNRITGDIPRGFGLMSNLVGLDLSRNRLQGRIPSSFGELKDLKSLLLAGNDLSGQIPVELVRIPSLNVLDLSSNSLSGEIPIDLVNLRNLTVLVLSNNKLSGKIPAGIANLTSLSIFNASFNNLSGPLPTNARMTCASVIGNPLLLQSCHAYSFSIPPSDLQGRSGDTQTYSNSPPDSAPSSTGTSGFSSIEIASITSAAAIVSVLLALILLYIYTRKCPPRSLAQSSGRKEITIFMDIGVPLTYESVVRATRSYNTSNCIGSGGFGATYKAEVSPGVVVAIKKLSTGRIHGDQQFHAEIKTLGRLRHVNLVTLIGYHLSEEEMFLIYNYLPGGNLERFIQERSKRPVDWRMLHKIALDVASALTYLHEQCAPRILHRDVKPSNILLDNECTAYLSDFGLARLLGNSETHATTGVEGTFGYVAPEYALLCRVSDKADVYSYGVVLMELISDKKVLDPSFSPYRNGFSIVNWANKLLSEGRIPEFFTQGLWDVAPRDDLLHTFRLAIKCTVDTVTDRPTMRQVVRRLKEIQPLAL